MLDETAEQLLKHLDSIAWREATAITSKADELARQHVDRMRAVISSAKTSRGISTSEAYAEAQSAGYDASGHDDVQAALFRKSELSWLPERNHVILAIVSNCFWKDDHHLGTLENPWSPLMELYELGYTSSFDESETGDSLDVIIHWKDGDKRYKVV